MRRTRAGQVRFLRPWNVIIDLGTANIRVAVRGRGVVHDQPAVLAFHRRNGTVVATGRAAKRMIGRTPPHLLTLSPIRTRGLDDTRAVHHLLVGALASTQRLVSVLRPRVLVAVSRGTTTVEASALARMVARAGASNVHVVDGLATTAVSVGSLRAHTRPMVIADIGAGSSDVALIGSEGIVTSAELRGGGDEVDARIARYLRDRHRIEVGDLTLEQLKLTLLSAQEPDPSPAELRSWDPAAQAPRHVRVTADELRGLVAPLVERCVDGLEALLDANPDFPRDIVERGIVLAGGGAQLWGLAEAVRRRLDVPALLGDHAPLMTVLGGLVCLDRPQLLDHVSRTGTEAAPSDGAVVDARADDAEVVLSPSLANARVVEPVEEAAVRVLPAPQAS